MLIADSGDGAAWVLAVPIVIAAYFLPTIIAFKRGHAYKNIILALNVFGFTGFFWLGSFIWAVWPSEKSLVDPVFGNVTGTGKRNAGDTAGAVVYGGVRGAFEEHRETGSTSAVGGAVDKAVDTGRAAAGAVADLVGRASASKQQESVLDQLGKLADLRSRGVLSEDEFQAMKAKLLGS